MTDRYTKVVLTAIAIALVVIAVKVWQPEPAYAGLFDGPTLGEYRDSKNKRQLRRQIPMVHVLGGNISVN
ncbi:MAG TPA: hypothetical protein DHW54_01980 [Gemmatimonadetes bacterium]|nr:hypothetical protein [Gemmatimonadota bacterium]